MSKLLGAHTHIQASQRAKDFDASLETNGRFRASLAQSGFSKGLFEPNKIHNYRKKTESAYYPAANMF